jgi:hypothetical protein
VQVLTSNVSNFVLYVHVHSYIEKINECVKKCGPRTSILFWLCSNTVAGNIKISQIPVVPFYVQETRILSLFILISTRIGLYKVSTKTSSPCVWISGVDSCTPSYKLLFYINTRWRNRPNFLIVRWETIHWIIQTWVSATWHRGSAYHPLNWFIYIVLGTSINSRASYCKVRLLSCN